MAFLRTIVRLFRACLATFIEPWPVEPIPSAAIGQIGKKLNTTIENFPIKTFTKQKIGLKTPSSYRTIPIPDYVFETILEELQPFIDEVVPKEEEFTRIEN